MDDNERIQTPNFEEKDEIDSETKKKDFSKVMNEFLDNMLDVFPEVTNDINDAKSMDSADLFDYCKKIYPERFFDVLYQNDDIFTDKDINTNFIPNVDFKKLWQFEGVSEGTKTTIWKYLQLITFSIISNIDSDSSFGDTAKLFEAINEDSFKEKLEETLGNIQSAFKDENGEQKINEEDMPNSDDLHNHLQGMLNGKIGQLANEIAEETAKELEIDMENPDSANDVFSKIIKNPKKLMGLVKSIGTKLEDKIKSGEIKESELMTEASEMMKNMKDMPGMGNISQMMSSMGMPGMGKKTKLNMGAMQSKLNDNIRMAKTKERLREKADARRREKSLQEEVNRLKAELASVEPQNIDEIVAEIEAMPEKTNNDNHNKQQKKKKKKKIKR
jgi:hypothetical protein